MRQDSIPPPIETIASQHLLEVELAKERPTLQQALPRGQLARLPAPDPRGEVAGEHLVLRPVVLTYGPELERPGDPAVVAEQLMHRLRAERQEGRQDRREGVDRP